jgi:hypothetical protein
MTWQWLEDDGKVIHLRQYRLAHWPNAGDSIIDAAYTSARQQPIFLVKYGVGAAPSTINRAEQTPAGRAATLRPLGHRRRADHRRSDGSRQGSEGGADGAEVAGPRAWP